LRQGDPLWLDHRRRRSSYAPLRGAHDADVVVIGGGITGVLTALGLAEAGAAVCLLEAGGIGAGSTAASSALLIHEPDRGFLELCERYGRDKATRIWRLADNAVRDLIGILKRHRIRCDLAERDAVYVAMTDSAVRQLRNEFDARRAAGFRQSWLGPRRLQRRTGIAGAAGVLSRHNAQCDPYKACVGLAERAAASGARIFERSKATAIHQRNGRVRIRTRSGHVDADTVVIATGYATPAFRPLIGHFRMYDTYVLATPALSASTRRRLGLSDELMWDADRPYHYFRWTPDHRLLLGGGDRPVGTTLRKFSARGCSDLRNAFGRLFPQLASIEIERAWHGLFALTPDSLPLIGRHRRYPHHLFALGYGGNGMTFGALAARMLVEQWQGSESPDHALFRFSRFR
jgi:glycine/D-amino acid oxidase-like deaminating enzyme